MYTNRIVHGKCNEIIQYVRIVLQKKNMKKYEKKINEWMKWDEIMKSYTNTEILIVNVDVILFDLI